MLTTGQKTSVCSCMSGTVLRNTARLSLLICLLACTTGGRLVGHTNNVRDPSHLHLPTIQYSTAPNDDDDARGSKESSATTTTTANHTQVPVATLPKPSRTVQYCNTQTKHKLALFRYLRTIQPCMHARQGPCAMVQPKSVSPWVFENSKVYIWGMRQWKPSGFH